MMRILLVAALAAAATAAAADSTSGTIAGFDATANTMTLTDGTVWYFAPSALPTGLEVGQNVNIDFTSAGESGVVAINGVYGY